MPGGVTKHLSICYSYFVFFAQSRDLHHKAIPFNHKSGHPLFLECVLDNHIRVL